MAPPASRDNRTIGRGVASPRSPEEIKLANRERSRKRRQREDEAKKRANEYWLSREEPTVHLSRPKPNFVVNQADDQPTPESQSVVVEQAFAGNEWGDDPLRVLPRSEVIARLVAVAQDETQKVRNAQHDTKTVIETVTGSVAYYLKRVVEQFEKEDGGVDSEDLRTFLDQQRVPIDGRDRHIYARLARLLKARLNANLRNKIADVIAGACLKGIRACDLSDRCKEGFELGAKKKLSTGPSALGKLYREHEKAEKPAHAQTERQDIGASEGEKDSGRRGIGEAAAKAVRVLGEGVAAEQLTLRFRSRTGRVLKIGRVESDKDGIVFVEAC